MYPFFKRKYSFAPIFFTSIYIEVTDAEIVWLLGISTAQKNSLEKHMKILSTPISLDAKSLSML